MKQKAGLLLVIFLLAHLLGHTQQSLTGTWLACYQHELPGEKQFFIYRFFLRQTNNEIRGLGQAIGADVPLQQMGREDQQPQTAFRLNGLLAAGAASFRLHTSPSAVAPDVLPVFAFDCTPVSIPVEELFIRAPALAAFTNLNRMSMAKVDLVKISDSLPPAIIAALENDESGASLVKSKKARQVRGLRLAEVAAPKQQLIDRVEEVQAQITLPEDLLLLSVFDNGTIDNDTVSITLNGSEIVSRERLTQFPIKRVLSLDRRREHKLVLVAYNEGTVPPNTALLILESGSVRKQVHLGSTMVKNGVLLIKIQQESATMPANEKSGNR